MEKEDFFLYADTKARADGVMTLCIHAIENMGSEFTKRNEQARSVVNEKAVKAELSVKVAGDNDYLFEKSTWTTLDNCKAEIEVPGVRLYDPEHSYLYQVTVTLFVNGSIVSSFRGKLGFRTMEKKKREIYYNGMPLKLKGICYREDKSDFSGTKKDLILFKDANINFIRGIYGPFSESFLTLCDEMGFMVEDTAPFYEVGQEMPATQDLPHLRDEYIEKTRQMLTAGLNHVSVIIWSLGHDCAWGNNFGAAAEFIRSIDQTRALTFHLPMSIPEEVSQMDIWPVHYIDYRQPFDVCYDQMVIFHSPGTDENEIGYMTGQAEYEVPVLHEIWAPVACHNRDEIRNEPAIHDFWGESIMRFAEKSYHTRGCLGGAVIAGVDEGESFCETENYRWGILDENHKEKAEYKYLQGAYAPIIICYCEPIDGGIAIELENRCLFSDLSEYALVVGGRKRDDIQLMGAPKSRSHYEVPLSADEAADEIVLAVCETDSNRVIASACPFPKIKNEPLPAACYAEERLLIDEAGEDRIVISNDTYSFIFSKKTCLLTLAYVDKDCVISGGPFLNTYGMQLGEWIGKSIDVSRMGDQVQVKIQGSYEDTLDIIFYLHLKGDGSIRTTFEVQKLYRHMPHTVKAQIGISTGGLNEKGISYLLDIDYRTLQSSDNGLITDGRGTGLLVSDNSDGVLRQIVLDKAPECTKEAVIDCTDKRIRYIGEWKQMFDYCGDRNNTEMQSKRKGDRAVIHFEGSGICLYGPTDIGFGMCDIYLDGAKVVSAYSAYPSKVDFPGMSRGYEKRYRIPMYEVSGLEEGKHELTIVVLGECEDAAQNTYVSIDYAVVESKNLLVGTRMRLNCAYGFSRLVRGHLRREKIQLIPGETETFHMKLWRKKWN